MKASRTRMLIAGSLALLATVAAQSVRAQQPAKRGATPAAASSLAQPNVVVIIADDLGYADIGVQGATDIATPSIDRIANEGARFTSAYVVSPLCAPSRAGILTGRYPQRWGHEFNPGPENESPGFGIPKSEPTLAERLKPLGYASALIGKWHLGYSTENMPQAKGFDEFYGFVAATHRYAPKLIEFRGSMIRGTERAREREYLTDAIARESADFVRRHAARPFFLVVSFNAVHAPLEADPARMQRLKHIADRDRRTYAATLLAMDDGVGRILQALGTSGVSDRTIVVFLSDNGGATLSVRSSNGQLTGLKGLVNEGGVRVPFFVRWPGVTQPGSVIDSPVSALDIVPTVLAATRSPVDARLDGQDFAPLLTPAPRTVAPAAARARTDRTAQVAGIAANASRRLYWRLGDMWAIRDGDWKLVQYAGTPMRLYDITTDIGEHTNLASSRADVVMRLQREYTSWASTLAKPRWGVAEHIVRPPDESGGSSRR